MSDGLGESHTTSLEARQLNKQIASVHEGAVRVATKAEGRLTHIYSDRQDLFGVAKWQTIGGSPSPDELTLAIRAACQFS